MKMKASFLLLLLLSLIGLSFQIVIDWSPLNNATVSTDPHIRSLANATVNWHNKQRNAHITLLNVTRGFIQVAGYQGIGEFHYVLYVDVLQPKPNNRIALKHYQGVLFEMPRGGLLFVYFGKPKWRVG